MIRCHEELYFDRRNIPQAPRVEAGDAELLQLVKEENANLKLKIVEMNKQTQSDQAKIQQLQKDIQRNQEEPTVIKVQ